MQNNSPIAVFDSGVGGLSVYKAIKKLLPNEKIIYLADGAHFPYGNKKPADVRRLTLRALRFLTNPSSTSSFLPTANCQLQTKLVIVSCNTATVSGIDFYRKQIPHIPIIGVVPVVKTAAERTTNGRIAIISTVATARSAYQKKLIAKFCPNFHVFNLSSFPNFPNFPNSPDFSHSLLLNIGCPNLVTHVERGVTEGPELEKELRQILAPVIAAKCDVLALGCTHYPFLKQTIQKIFSENSDNSVIQKNQNVRKSGSQKTEKNSDSSDSLILRQSDVLSYPSFPKIPLVLDSASAVARHAKRILENNHLLRLVTSPNSPTSPISPSDLFLTTGNAAAFAKTIKKLLGIEAAVKKIVI